MINAFVDRFTERVWRREHIKRMSVELERQAPRKLLILNRATTINDLRVPPGKRLEKLVGNRAGQYSIRINDQFRICFRWTPSGVEDVEITDYHQGVTMPEKAFAPVTPGEVLLEEFLIPMGISQYRLAKTIGVPPRRINEIVHGKRRITPDTGLRISKALGMSPRFFVDLQLDFDMEIELEEHRDEIDAIEPLAA